MSGSAQVTLLLFNDFKKMKPVTATILKCRVLLLRFHSLTKYVTKIRNKNVANVFWGEKKVWNLFAASSLGLGLT